VSAWLDVSCKSVLTQPDSSAYKHGRTFISWVKPRCVILNQTVPGVHSVCRLLLLASCLTYSSTLKKEAVCCSDTWVNFYRTAPLYIPKDSLPQSNRSWEYQIQQNIPDSSLSKTIEILPNCIQTSVRCGQRGVESSGVHSITCTYICSHPWNVYWNL
jgi:hypothetical protein